MFVFDNRVVCNRSVPKEEEREEAALGDDASVPPINDRVKGEHVDEEFVPTEASRDAAEPGDEDSAQKESVCEEAEHDDEGGGGGAASSSLGPTPRLFATAKKAPLKRKPPPPELTPSPPTTPPWWRRCAAADRPRARADSAHPAETEEHLESTTLLADWATFEKDAGVWARYLTERSVDATAQRELFLLSQLSDLGYSKANTIIWKIIKKEAESIPIQNPSAFIHVCCKRARYALQPEEE